MVYLFLCGAEMEPERVRSAWPEARFVARAHLQPRPLGAVATPAGARYEIWGIVIEIPDAPVTGDTRAAVADGRVFDVTVPPPDDPDPAAVLAAARYWEVPPPYVRRLMSAAHAPVEDYVY